MSWAGLTVGSTGCFTRGTVVARSGQICPERRFLLIRLRSGGTDALRREGLSLLGEVLQVSACIAAARCGKGSGTASSSSAPPAADARAMQLAGTRGELHLPGRGQVRRLPPARPPRAGSRVPAPPHAPLTESGHPRQTGAGSAAACAPRAAAPAPARERHGPGRAAALVVLPLRGRAGHRLPLPLPRLRAAARLPRAEPRLPGQRLRLPPVSRTEPPAVPPGRVPAGFASLAPPAEGPSPQPRPRVGGAWEPLRGAAPSCAQPRDWWRASLARAFQGLFEFPCFQFPAEERQHPRFGACALCAPAFFPPPLRKDLVGNKARAPGRSSAPAFFLPFAVVWWAAKARQKPPGHNSRVPAAGRKGACQP